MRDIHLAESNGHHQREQSEVLNHQQPSSAHWV